MTEKYLKQSSGNIVEQTPAVAGGGGSIGQIPALDGAGLLPLSMMPVGIGPETESIPVSEALAAGALVNVWLDSSTVKARNADATTSGKPAHGFVLSAYPTGTAIVYFGGKITGLSSLTKAATYFLGTTPGTITAIPPSASGNIVQKLGVAVSDTELAFEPQDFIVLA